MYVIKISYKHVGSSVCTGFSMLSLCVMETVSPAQLFAVTERSSISQAASCLIDELPQRYDSLTHMHAVSSASHYTVHLKLVLVNSRTLS